MADIDSQLHGTPALIGERLLALEKTLQESAPGSAQDRQWVQHIISELQSIRSQLIAVQGAPTAGKSTDAQPSAHQPATSQPSTAPAADPALDKSVDRERMARAMSELKSGEFDVQG